MLKSWNKRRALHASPPEIELSEDSGVEATVVLLGLRGCGEDRGTRVVVGYGMDQLALTSSITEAGILPAGENIR